MNKETLFKLFQSGKKYDIKGIKKALNVRDQDFLFALLNELQQEGKIYCQNGFYASLKNRDDLMVGVLQINKKGRASVDNVIILSKDLGCSLNGDIVLVRKAFVDRKNKAVYGVVEKILKQKDGFMLVNFENGQIKPYHNYFPLKIKIKNNAINNLPNDTRIKVKIDANFQDDYVLADIVEVIGHKDDPDIDEKTVASINGFETTFSDNVCNEVLNMKVNITDAEILCRKDLRSKEIFTIDGIDTKDMDDAISLEVDSHGNYHLGVHIADVSHYVRPNSQSYKCAMQRSTSLYINNTSIPMLHRNLSNNICSLNPHEDRLCKSIDIIISPDGTVLDYQIYSSVINSRIKMNYDTVNNILEANEIPAEYLPFADTLRLMDELSKILEKIKISRGYLSFAETDIKMVTDEAGYVQEFKNSKQKNAEKIIENFMLIANECVGNYFYNMGMPAIYRVHESPDAERLNEIMLFITSLGYKIRNIKNIENPYVVQGILKDFTTLKEFPLLSNMILRGMKKAKYSSVNIGHFGLALDNYIQFTSPIRRFPDLMTYTILTMFESMNYNYEDYEYLENFVQNVAEHSSYKERMADKAEKEGLELKMIDYMNGHIGDVFEGIITQIGRNYLTVKASNIDGKVFFSSIPGFFVPDQNYTRITSKNAEYKVGDFVDIKVVSASRENHLIEYSIVKKKDKILKRQI